MKVEIAPNNAEESITLDFDTIGIDEVMAHIKSRDFDVPRKSGIGGCHDMTEWDKLRKEDEGYDIEVGTTLDKVPEVIIHSKIEHNRVPGVYLVKYSIPAVDGKAKNGNTTGALKEFRNPKTLYDPEVWTDEKLKQSLKEAITAAAASNGGTLTREWSGNTADGYTLRGYYNIEEGKITSFFFE